MTFSPSFRPRLLDALRGYGQSRWLADVGAGVTVGIVALPLAMAFAIASGLKPEAGLWTAIIAGFLISALGGTNAQIGGPAGAFIVIVYGIVERYGVANLLISTACAGVLLVLLGLFRLGTLVRYVPVSIVIGCNRVAPLARRDCERFFSAGMKPSIFSGMNTSKGTWNGPPPFGASPTSRSDSTACAVRPWSRSMK